MARTRALAVTSRLSPPAIVQKQTPSRAGSRPSRRRGAIWSPWGQSPIAITDNASTLPIARAPRDHGRSSCALHRGHGGRLSRTRSFPVVSGNVSLYNETNGVAIPPTPTVGAVGLLPNYDVVTGFSTMAEGDALVLIGQTHGELGTSIYLREVLGREDGAPPPVDLKLERKTGDFVRGLIEAGDLTVVHDLSDGGLIGAAADLVLASDVGVTLDASSATHAHIFLFGEDQARYLVAVSDPDALIAPGSGGGPPRLGRRPRRRGRLRLQGRQGANCSASPSPTCANGMKAGCPVGSKRRAELAASSIILILRTGGASCPSLRL